jgi:predicted DNA-binding transcriptional regulator YafY
MSQNKNRAYYHIISLFNNKKSVNSRQMQETLESEGLPASQRSIARLKGELKDIGLEMEYNSATRSYTLDVENNSLQERIINLMIASDFLQNLSAHPKKMLQYIDFDKRTVSKGVNFLSEIFEAIIQSYWVEITYQRYNAEMPKTHIIAPLFLKEYNNRWYVLAITKANKTHKNNAPLLWGLDRIISLKKLNKAPKNLFQTLSIYKQFKEDLKTKPFDIFCDIVGVSFSDEHVQKVVLSFEGKEAPYLESQPWHHSQEVLMKNKDEFRIALYVRPNDDLITLILSQCGRVKVLEPDNLRNRIKEILERANKNYE